MLCSIFYIEVEKNISGRQ